MRDEKSSADYWADWLVDAVATATQDRRFLRGDPAEDRAATEALRANGKKALQNFLRYAVSDIYGAQAREVLAGQVDEQRTETK